MAKVGVRELDFVDSRDVLLVPACSYLASQAFFLFESTCMCTLVYNSLVPSPAHHFRVRFANP